MVCGATGYGAFGDDEAAVMRLLEDGSRSRLREKLEVLHTRTPVLCAQPTDHTPWDPALTPRGTQPSDGRW
jgi:hypothetical protein